MLQRARERARSAKETLRETGDAVLVSSSMDDLLRTRVRNNAAADARKTDALLFKQGMNHPLRATLDRERKQLEHQRLSMSQSQRVAQRQGQRGLSMGVGTFKAGVLHVGKRDLERMAANEPARRTGSRPGGGDGARVSLEGTSGRGRKAKHGGKGKKGGKKGGGKGRK